ncbi:MAG TPA: HDOD domain-containing protein [Bacillota bacterium]|nr:HDOD domain-containing protein [Bacillota bacterium]HOL09922.1 HDOD domain-containing protein [Bacillota bacterium]HPO96788.1 HDOD domain-containing protein [Bacillota bacterium]
MDRQEIFAKLNSADIPDLPQEIKDIFALIKNPTTSDLQLLISMIASYGQLEALLLSKFNNEYFSSRHRINTLQEGIKYFGLQTIQNLLLYLVIRSFASRIPDQTGSHRSNYWKHCLGTSIIAHKLAVATDFCDPYLMFSYGLIHDIGIFVIEYALPEVPVKVLELIKQGHTHVAAEKKVMDGVTHEEIGSWLCQRWALPEAIVNLVAFHHRPQANPVKNDAIILFNKADLLSTIFYQSLMGINSWEKQSQILNSLNLDPQLITAIKGQLPEEIQKARALFCF